jgi:hypothetical protein
MGDRRGWHFAKTIDAGHMLATLGLVAAMAAGYSDFRERLAVLEANQTVVTSQLTQILASQNSVDARQNAEIAEIRRDTRDTYREINHQLSTLISTTRSTSHVR